MLSDQFVDFHGSYDSTIIITYPKSVITLVSPSQKKIAIVTHRFVFGDGQGRVNLEVVRKLVGRGHAVHLISSDVDDELREHPEVTWHRIDVDGYPSELLRNQIFARKSSRILKSFRNAVDLIVVNGAITFGASDVNAVHMVHSAWLASKYHSSRGRYSPSALYQLLYTYVNARWERRAFQSTQRLVAVSGLLGDQIESLGIPRARIEVIPNGVDVSEFSPGHSEDRHGVSPDQLIGLFAGDIRRPLKNLDSVLTALVDHPRLHLLIAGDTEGSPYPDMARRMGLDQRVTFLGYRRDLPDLMKLADMYIFPSRYESFSLVLLEAMASSTPVITASTVGAANLVGDSGFVIEDPDDVQALSAAIGKLVADSELRKRMGAAGREIALKCTFEKMAQAYADLFEEMTTQ